MEPWSSNWSPGLRNKLPWVGLGYKTVAWDYPGTPGSHWQPFPKEFIYFQAPGNFSGTSWVSWASLGKFKLQSARSADPIAKNPPKNQAERKYFDVTNDTHFKNTS